MVLGLSGFLGNAALGLFSVLALVYGAELVVGKMEGLAKYYGISEVVIAVTIVSIGTSLPEMALHYVGSIQILLSSQVPLELFLIDPATFLLGSHSEIVASLANQGFITQSVAQASVESFRTTSGTVIGASIGSDVVQETLVMGLVIISSALLAERRGFRFSRKFLLRDYAPMIGTTLITLILALNWRGLFKFLTGGSLNLAGTLTRLDGLILVGSFMAYMYYLYTTRDEKLAEQGDVESSQNPFKDILIGISAMIVVVVSAEVFLRVVKLGVEQTGLSGSMIGVATVGIVSALPEMSTAISGLRHGSEAVSLGTLVGSNVTNPLLAIGGGALISSYTVPRPVILWDLPMEVFLAGIPVLYMMNRKRIGKLVSKPIKKLRMDKKAEKVSKTDNYVLSIAGAVLLVLLYFFYLYVRFKYFPHDFKA